MKAPERLGKRILRVLFPRGLVCASCGREAVTDSAGLCADCRGGIEVFNSAPPIEFVDGYTAAYVYNDVSSAMVKRLKYSGARYLSKPLADAVVLPEDWNIDVIVPVPLHYKRIAERGYNQSELIARHIADRIKTPLKPCMLVRRKNTPQQTKLSEASRKRNMKYAFLADEECNGLNILLVDDVRTTGATLSACAKELKNHGAAKVFAVTCCFANPRIKGEIPE